MVGIMKCVVLSRVEYRAITDVVTSGQSHAVLPTEESGQKRGLKRENSAALVFWFRRKWSDIDKIGSRAPDRTE